MSTSQTEEVEVLQDTYEVPELKLLESVDTPTGPHTGAVIAVLDGPVIDYKNPTRNDRLYEEELWDLIFSSDYIQELIDTKNFLGEPNHPMKYQGRADIHYPEVSHAVRNLRKVPEEGKFYATFDILDTPNGRILKTLIDYGTKLGASSRGSGRTKLINGKPVVDKTTYRFFTFDIVHMPGNKVARLEGMNEAVTTISSTLSEQVDTYIESGDTQSLQAMVPVLNFLSESQDVNYLLDKINESLDIDSSNTIAEYAAEDLVNAYSQVKELKVLCESKESIINEKDEELEKSVELSESLQNTLSEVESKYHKSSEMAKHYLLESQRLSKSNSLLESKLAESKSLIDNLKGENKELSESMKLNKIRSTNSDSNTSKQLSLLTESLEIAQSEITKYDSELNESLQRTEEFASSYISLRCNQLGLNESLVLANLSESLPSYTPSSLEVIFKDMWSSKINSMSNIKPLVESSSARVTGTIIPKDRPLNESSSQGSSTESNNQLSSLVRYAKGL